MALYRIGHILAALACQQICCTLYIYIRRRKFFSFIKMLTLALTLLSIASAGDRFGWAHGKSCKPSAWSGVRARAGRACDNPSSRGCEGFEWTVRLWELALNNRKCMVPASVPLMNHRCRGPVSSVIVSFSVRFEDVCERMLTLGLERGLRLG